MSALTDAMADALAGALHDIGAVKLGSFTLKDGDVSPIYLDLRLLISAPAVLGAAARAYATVLEELDYDRIAAIPYAGLPLGVAVALETGRPLIYPRKEVKRYGTGRAIEGAHEAGETIVVLDDVISSGASKLEAIAPLEAAGLRVRDVVVLVDRETGGAAEIAAAGYRLHAALTLRQIVDRLAAADRVSDAERTAVETYLRRAAGARQNERPGSDSASDPA